MSKTKSRLQKSMEKQKATEADFLDLVKRTEIALINTKLGGEISFEKMMYESSYGVLTPDMRRALDEHIFGKRIYDLGAGDLTMSRALLKMGALHVVAIDKELNKGESSNITKWQGHFSEFLQSREHKPQEGDVAFLSWPDNHEMYGLLDLLTHFEKLIYLGRNYNGSSCAWPMFFARMTLRPVLAHVPHERNTLIIYGKEGSTAREMLGEELAGNDHSKMYEFEELRDEP